MTTPIALLTSLLRVDTTNPPGNERACAEVLAGFLRADGYDPQLLEKVPGRANLVVRRRGDGSAGGPLLLTGHMDVVPADPARWRHPPFAGEIADGWLYGRGAVDMKNHLAACAEVMRRLAREQVRLKRDVIFAAVADEEAGCALGAQYLVDEHPDAVRAEWALGELGGFTLHLGGQRLYPIQIAHRGAAWMTLRAKGRPGHGSMPSDDNAVLKLARALLRIGNQPLPIHVTAPARAMLQGLGAARGGVARLALALLARPALTDYMLANAISDPQLRRTFGALLRNTAVPTGLSAGIATNVIPPSATAQIDGRVLPGQTTADLLRELAEVVDDEGVEVEVFRELAPVESPVGSPLYGLLAEALKEMDPGGLPFPSMTPGFTDASAFSRLGTRFYGFTPVVLPAAPPVAFNALYHGDDERIPVEGFERGVDALWRVVTRFCA